MIKLTTFEDGSGHVLEIGKRITVHFYNDWKQLFQIGHCNWYSFTFVYIFAEYTQITKGYEITCILLGLGFILHYNRDFEHSEMQRLADEAWEEITAERNRAESELENRD